MHPYKYSYIVKKHKVHTPALNNENPEYPCENSGADTRQDNLGMYFFFKLAQLYYL